MTAAAAGAGGDRRRRDGHGVRVEASRVGRESRDDGARVDAPAGLLSYRAGAAARFELWLMRSSSARALVHLGAGQLNSAANTRSATRAALPRRRRRWSARARAAQELGEDLPRAATLRAEGGDRTRTAELQGGSAGRGALRVRRRALRQAFAGLERWRVAERPTAALREAGRRDGQRPKRCTPDEGAPPSCTRRCANASTACSKSSASASNSSRSKRSRPPSCTDRAAASGGGPRSAGEEGIVWSLELESGANDKHQESRC